MMTKHITMLNHMIVCIIMLLQVVFCFILNRIVYAILGQKSPFNS